MTDRDQLAALIHQAEWDADSAPESRLPGFDSDKFIADAILAAGWRAPEPPCEQCGHSITQHTPAGCVDCASCSRPGPPRFGRLRDRLTQ